MERSPADREAGTGLRAPGRAATVGILVCTFQRWLRLLLKKAEAGLAPQEQVKAVLFLPPRSYYSGEECCTGLGCEDRLWHSDSLQK